MKSDSKAIVGTIIGTVLTASLALAALIMQSNASIGERLNRLDDCTVSLLERTAVLEYQTENLQEQVDNLREIASLSVDQVAGLREQAADLGELVARLREEVAGLEDPTAGLEDRTTGLEDRVAHIQAILSARSQARGGGAKGANSFESAA